MTENRGRCSAQWLIINRIKKNPLLLRQSGIPFFLFSPSLVPPRRGNKCTLHVGINDAKKTRCNLAAGNLNVNSRQRRVACCYGSRNGDLHTGKGPGSGWKAPVAAFVGNVRDRCSIPPIRVTTITVLNGFRSWSRVPNPSTWSATTFQIACSGNRGLHTWRFVVETKIS